jgi:hypothetical protein
MITELAKFILHFVVEVPHRKNKAQTTTGGDS